MKISIIGSGSFGTALAKILCKKNSVHILSIDKKAIYNINKFRINKDYLPNTIIPKQIIINSDWTDVKKSNAIIICVPSSSYQAVLKNIKTIYSKQIIISASKGITDYGKPLTDLILKELNCRSEKVVVLTGPSIAHELASGKPTKVIIGGNRNTTQKIKNDFECNKFYIKCSEDRDGIQYLGFYKNLIAILVGLCDGLNLGNNFKSALVTKAYSEFYYSNNKKLISRHSYIDLAGLGDLYVTSTSNDSRNRNFGLYLSEYNSIDQIKRKIGNVIEGYESLIKIKDYKIFYWVDKKLIETLNNIIIAKNKKEKKEILLEYLNSRNIENIVFDWGGVLTKGNYSDNVASIIAKKLRKSKKKIYDFLTKNEQNLLKGKQDFKSYYNKFSKNYSISYEDFEDSFKNGIIWNEEMLNYCKKLVKEYSLYLISNNYYVITPIIKKKLDNIFKGMIFSNELGILKPSDEIYLKFISKYKINPRNCIYIDDLYENTLGAERNKMVGVKYENISKLKKIIKESI